MHFINIERGLFVVIAGFHPDIVTELIFKIIESGSRTGTLLAPEGIRVRVINETAVFPHDSVFVELPLFGLRNFHFIELPVVDLLHRDLFPAGKLSDHRNSERRRGVCPEDIALPDRVSAQERISIKGIASIKFLKIHHDLLAEF